MMQLDREKGILLGVNQVQSPNYNQRPPGVSIDMIVVHNISLPPGEFGGPYIDAFFTNQLIPSVHPYFEEIQSLKTSCHCLIRRTGELIQYVPFILRAWHAGASYFQGRENCNDFSIGIELEGTDEIPFTEIQYVTLTKLIILLQKNYPTISSDRIVGHSTIAPSRKTDPGPAFDWGHLRQLMQVDFKDTLLENKEL